MNCILSLGLKIRAITPFFLKAFGALKPFFFAVVWLILVFVIALVSGTAEVVGPFTFDPLVWTGLVGTVPAAIVLIAEYVIATRTPPIPNDWRGTLALIGILAFVFGLACGVVPTNKHWHFGDELNFVLFNVKISTCSTVLLLVAVLSGRLWAWTENSKSTLVTPTNVLTGVNA